MIASSKVMCFSLVSVSFLNEVEVGVEDGTLEVGRDRRPHIYEPLELPPQDWISYPVPSISQSTGGMYSVYSGYRIAVR